MSLEPGGLLPAAVPDYVILEGVTGAREGEGEGERRRVTRRVFVTEVSWVVATSGSREREGEG